MFARLLIHLLNLLTKNYCIKHLTQGMNLVSLQQQDDSQKVISQKLFSEHALQCVLKNC